MNFMSSELQNKSKGLGQKASEIISSGANQAGTRNVAHSSSVNNRERVKKRSPSGPSSENMPPRPGTTSIISCVCLQYSYCAAPIKNRQPPISPNNTSLSPLMNSPSRYHMGALPSQQPPDWWNIKAPYLALSFSINANALSVAITFLTASIVLNSIAVNAKFPPAYSAARNQD